MSESDISGSELSVQLANLIKNGFNSQPQNRKLSDNLDNLQINLKLNSKNYALWTRKIRVAIGGKSKSLLKHLTKNPPDPTNASYEQWEQDDLVVFSWLIQNIEPVLASNLTEFPTAKVLWESLVVIYSSGGDDAGVGGSVGFGGLASAGDESFCFNGGDLENGCLPETGGAHGEGIDIGYQDGSDNWTWH